MKNILIATAILAASTSAHANLLVNGSFEEPGQASGTYSFYNAIPGWTAVEPGKIELRNNIVGTAQDGNNFVELDADTGSENSSMFQDVATSVGAVYELSYWYSPRIGESFNTNGIQAFWNGASLAISRADGGSVNNWVQLIFSVTGTGNDRLQFTAIGTPDTLGGNIDNVQLNAVPVPAAAWLFGSALGLFGLARRRSV